MEIKNLLSMSIQVAQEAGTLIHNLSEQPIIISKKDSFDLVTNADKAASDLITQRLLELCPGSQVLSEESPEIKIDQKSDGILWIVDPIDGTTNFARKIPHAAVCIAAYDFKSREILVGCVNNPFSKECFWASKNQGAFLNHQRIHVSSTLRMQDSVASSGYFNHGGLTYENSNLPETYVFLKNCLGIRRNGAASLDLCWVAMGRFDIYWEKGLHSWDMAAGVLIVQEAGGQVSNYAGKSFDVFQDEVLSTNQILHAESVSLLQTAHD